MYTYLCIYRFIYIYSNLCANLLILKEEASGPIASWQIDGETVADFIFWGSKSQQMVIAAMKLKDTYSLEGKL